MPGKTLADWTEADLARWFDTRRIQKANLPASQTVQNIETTDTLTVSNNLQLSPQAIAYLKGVVGSGRETAYGTGTLTFSASVTSGVTTVSHGLSTTPTVVLAQSQSGSALCWIQVTAVTSTQISFQGRDVSNTSRTGSNGFFWTAVV